MPFFLKKLEITVLTQSVFIKSYGVLYPVPSYGQTYRITFRETNTPRHIHTHTPSILWHMELDVS